MKTLAMTSIITKITYTMITSDCDVTIEVSCTIIFIPPKNDTTQEKQQGSFDITKCIKCIQTRLNSC